MVQGILPADTQAEWQVNGQTQATTELSLTLSESVLQPGLNLITTSLRSVEWNKSINLELTVNQWVKAIELREDTDSNGDGVSDAETGVVDINNNGMLDAYETSTRCDVIPVVSGSAGGLTANTAPGLCIRKGDLSLDSPSTGIGMTIPEDAKTEALVTTSPLYDFKVYGSRPNVVTAEIFALVLPLGSHYLRMLSIKNIQQQRLV